MKIIVESYIPFITGKLEARGHEVTYLAPEEFLNDTVRDADALIVRTRTKCDSRLLDGTAVKKIATATIGTDHIDMNYCRKHGIEVFNAPGCNAPAVAQYVLSSINALGIKSGTIGIVGVGHVGSIVDRWARANGYETRLCDPPLGLNDSVFDADVITFHTLLDETTRHMANAEFFDSCTNKPLIINAARGAVVDTPALLCAIKKGRVRGAVIDCWEGEPNISRALLSVADIATPHIAGYSLQGKRRATAMALAAIDTSVKEDLDPVAWEPSIRAIAESYDPIADSLALKLAPEAFESLRNHYTYRHEPR
ncbi:MAG: 4-phosphoerythronate dehydrogenase [Bacteroides sp.]|nr:4-phosphoerythronate dehydrogenase [Bacteroides sp.]MCM1378897.1 4-phosphoerythronate dehydrogenase [Bacteroides sp.]MCM1445513.1 4-phosphoerythronate dehydrogenase [Prevotella sp.]